MKFRFKSILCVICLSFMTTTAFSASNQHIKLEGIEGESKDCALTKGSKVTKKPTANATGGRTTQPGNGNASGPIKAARNNSAAKKKLIKSQTQQSCR